MDPHAMNTGITGVYLFLGAIVYGGVRFFIAFYKQRPRR